MTDDQSDKSNSTGNPTIEELVKFLTQAQDARRAHPLTSRRLEQRRHPDVQRSMRPWIGERTDSATEQIERVRAKERHTNRNKQAAAGEQFKAEGTDAVFGELTPDRPFNGGRRLLQLTPLTISAQYKGDDQRVLDALFRLLAPDLLEADYRPPCSEQEAREVLTDLFGPRQGAPSRQEQRNEEVHRIVDKLERHPRIRFKLICWAADQFQRDIPRSQGWYIPLCVKHNLDPHTGASLPQWQTQQDCLHRLSDARHDPGVSWVPGNDPRIQFAKYIFHAKEGSRALDIAKWRTLHEDEHRRQVWTLSDDIETDPDFRALMHADHAIIHAMEQKYLRDRNLLV